MHIKAKHYFKPYKIYSKFEAKKFLTYDIKKRLGRKPRFEIDSKIFETHLNGKLLPSNTIIRVKGPINKAFHLLGDKTTELKASAFNAGLKARGALKLNIDKVVGFLKLTGNIRAKVGNITGNSVIKGGSKLEANAQTGYLKTTNNAFAKIGRLVGDFRASGNSRGDIHNLAGDTLHKDFGFVFVHRRFAGRHYTIENGKTVPDKDLFSPFQLEQLIYKTNRQTLRNKAKQANKTL